MSRLEKKCLVSSAGAHGLVVLLLTLSPFLWPARHQSVVLPPINFIPTRLIDGAMSGGGSPTAKELPKPAPAMPVAAPIPAPAKPAPVEPITSVEPEPAQVKPPPEAPTRPRKTAEVVPKDNSKIETAKPSTDGKPSRKKIELSFDRDSSSSSTSKKPSAAEARAQAAASARAAQAQYAAQIQSVLGAIGQGVSSGTSIEVPGPGGEAFADYGQWVVAVYQRAWTPPTNLADELATVEVTVVILRNGTVESFKVTRRSGHSALDKSVERLRQVTSIAAFPEGTTDAKRTFVIEFNLRSKRSF